MIVARHLTPFVKIVDEVTRNFIEGPETDKMIQMALKIPWNYSVMTDVDYHVYDSQEDFYMVGAYGFSPDCSPHIV